MIKNPSQDEYERIINSEEKKENDIELEIKAKDSLTRSFNRGKKKYPSEKNKEKLPPATPSLHQITRNKNIFIDYIEKEQITKEKDDEKDKNFVLFFPDFYDIDFL